MSLPEYGLVNDILSQALQPVLHDIKSTGAPTPNVRDEDWADDPLMASAMLWSAEGSGTGISVDLRIPEHDRVMRVTDQVQEWVIEQLWGAAATNWPSCPNHPGGHPLAASTRESRAVWVCPTDGMPFSPIGSLR